MAIERGLLLDSSVIIAAERQQLDLAAHTRARRGQAFVSVVTAAELLHGVHRANTPHRRVQRSAFVEAVLAQFPLVDIDLAAARVQAELWARLAKAGTLIGAHDLWIAASALSINCSLATTNVREFKRVPDLVVEEWQTRMETS